MLTLIEQTQIVETVRSQLPHVESVYLFGSFASNDERSDSDIDIAICLSNKPTAEAMYQIKTDLSYFFLRDVDIVDLKRADTVTQAQVVTSSLLLYCVNAASTHFFETTVLSSYAQLNLERREIVESIIKKGRIYG